MVRCGKYRWSWSQSGLSVLIMSGYVALIWFHQAVYFQEPVVVKTWPELHQTTTTEPNLMRCNQTSPPGRLLLYVTTVLSSQHISWMKCWPARIWPKLKRLQQADVLLYVGATKDASGMHSHKRMAATLLATWPNTCKNLRFGERYLGKQRGAMKAMHDAVSKGWFKEYDWIIRINPDVFIFDEKPMLRLMRPRTWGVFYNCRNVPPRYGCGNNGVDACRVFQTDWFAVRPDKINKNAFADWPTFRDIAEVQATKGLRNIINASADAWLEPRAKGICRVTGHGLWHENSFCEDVLARKPWLKHLDGP